MGKIEKLVLEYLFPAGKKGINIYKHLQTLTNTYKYLQIIDAERVKYKLF